MVDCGPSCTVPSFASIPTVGIGSAGGLGYGGLGHELGGLDYGYGGLGYGYGGAERTTNLGVLAGVAPSCINPIPLAEVVIQLLSCNVTIPGPILSANCEPVAFAGNTPCAVGGSGLIGGYGYGTGLLGSSFGGYGLRRGGFFGKGALVGRGDSVCV